MNLATFTHISDLHFGITDPDTFDAEASRLWPLLPMFDGLLGHKYFALTALASFWLDRLDEDELTKLITKLIVTGDLTTKGHPVQFETADEFLGAELVPPKGRGVGLRIKDWRDWAIPGNHDNWPGTALMIGLGLRTNALTHAFGKTFPFTKGLRIPPATGKYLVTFIWIDTDADVRGFHPNRAWARGSFVSQLKEVKRMLSARADNEIRVLCLHHSLAHKDYSMGICDDSRSELNNLIIEQEISVLLCGHVHQPPLVKAFTATSGARKRTYLEARCGTTTQQNFQESPYYWKKALAPLGIEMDREPNNLLLYRIEENASGLYWDTELYELRPSGFQPPLNLRPGRLVNPHFRLQ